MLRKSKQRGSTAVEVALLVPVIMLVVVGAVDFGRAVWSKNLIRHMATESARYASVRSVDGDDPATASSVAAHADTLAGPLDRNKVTVTTTWQPDNSRGSTVRVQVTYLFEPVIPLIPIESIALSSASRLLVSY